MFEWLMFCVLMRCVYAHDTLILMYKNNHMITCDEFIYNKHFEIYFFFVVNKQENKITDDDVCCALYGVHLIIQYEH